MIHHETRGATAVLTIDRPQRRNAVDTEACEQLLGALTKAVEDDTRVVVLTGAGGHFCAGADLTGVHDDGFGQALRALLDALVAVPVPVIAAIDGAALGAGTQLAVSCDLRVATPAARFGIPAAKLGLMVDHWTLERVARTWGEGAARLMVLTATVLDADDAWRLGFAQQRGDLPDAQALAARAAALAPLSQTGSKIGFDAHHDNSAEVARYEDAFARAWASDDLGEGRRAFTERRTAAFRGH
jgi:enoyl-CoA hydratase